MKHLRKAFSALLCICVVASLCGCNNADDVTNEEPMDRIPVITEEVAVEQVTDFQKKESPRSQLDLTVDGWLKIISIGERDGVLSVFVRNVSEEDIQYAMLTVQIGEGKAEFPVSTLTAGSSATLRCTNGFVFNEDAVYYSWTVSDKALFQNELTCYPETFEISGVDGYISIKNISDKDIDGKIYIYYKNVTDGVYDDGTTYRAYVEGLEAGQTADIRTQHYLKDSSRILFVTYGE